MQQQNGAGGGGEGSRGEGVLVAQRLHKEDAGTAIVRFGRRVRRKSVDVT